MATKVIIIVSKKLKRHRYRRDENRYVLADSNLQPEHAREEGADFPKDLLEECEIAPSPISNESEDMESTKARVLTPCAEGEEKKAAGKKKGLFKRKDKPQKDKKKTKKEKRTRSKAAAAKNENKAAIKSKFQQSTKVKKFSIFEPVETKETMEEIIEKTLNDDGYYNAMNPEDNGKATKSKKPRDNKQIAILAGLVIAATILLTFFIREVNSLF